jgi:hypothetical protein
MADKAGLAGGAPCGFADPSAKCRISAEACRGDAAIAGVTGGRLDSPIGR